MTTRSSILAWKIPWTQEPGGLQSVGSQRGGYSCQSWATEPRMGRNLTTWMTCEDTMLSEKPDTRGHVLILLYNVSRIGKSDGNQWPRGWGNDMWLLHGSGLPSGVTERFWNWIEKLVAHHYEYTQYHWIFYFFWIFLKISVILPIIFFSILFTYLLILIFGLTTGHEGS